MKISLSSRLGVVVIPAIMAIAPSAWSKTNRIEITMPETAREAIKAKEKVEVPEASAIFKSDGEDVATADVKLETRGQTALKFPRKNFSMKFKGHDKGDGKKVILSAGAQDPLLIKNRFGYKIFALAGFPEYPTQLSEISINDEEQGLYMVSPAVDDLSLENNPSASVVLRRRYDDRVEIKKIRKGVSDEQAQEFVTALEDLHKNSSKLKGQALVDFLQKQINLSSYLRMIAINYLIHNSDYADEVFFVGSKDADGGIRFQALPWDLDDSFGQKMHMEKALIDFNSGRSKLSQKQMIFGFESRLDRSISENKALLDLYFAETAKLLTEITPEQITAAAEKVENQLTPYLFDENVLAAGALDQLKKPHNPSEAIESIRSKRDEVIARMQTMKSELALIKSGNLERSHKTNFIKNFLGTLFNKLMFNFTNKSEGNERQQFMLFY